MITKTDVAIIGGGVIGSAIARELSRYDLDVTLIERNEDVGGYASKCNSATLCSGHDAEPGSLEAKLTTASNRAYDRICEDLDVEMKRIGMIYVAQDDEEMSRLHEIKKRAILNGEYDAQLLSREKVHEMEPSINPDIVGGLFIPNEAIIDVMELCFAFVENAMDNGVHVLLGTKAAGIETDPETHDVQAVVTDKGTIECRFAINAAALYADQIAHSVGFCDYYNYPRTGQFFVMDKEMPYSPSHIVVPLPTPVSRGRLITPTIHGNCLIGPSADNKVDREDTKTDKATLDSIIADCRKMIPAIDPMDSITQFCGVRPAIYPKTDWRIRSIDGCKGYIEAVGISQGVSAAPGVVKYVAEIVQAIHKGPGARSVDAIKRRLRAGMGRCQGGFCGPRVVEILARELGVTEEDICKNEPGSEMLVRVNRK